MTMYLSASRGTLATRYDVALLDLDGVVYVGPAAVPGAAAALTAARAGGMRLAFVTNNAARPPAAVAIHLRELGIPADVSEVVTSAQAAAHYLARELPPASRVLVVGTTGLVEALTEQGLVPVSTADDAPVAVVQGYSPDLDWRLLAEGAVAIRRGARWVATNLDATVPSARGPLPGNGSMVAALRHATGLTPFSTGKPDPTMHAETVERTGARHPIVVGDRLDTDIEGARRVGCASLLVLSGVTDAAELIAAGPDMRPDYVAGDVGGLLVDHPGVVGSEGQARCGRWLASLEAGVIALRSEPGTSGDASRGSRGVSVGEGDTDGVSQAEPGGSVGADVVSVGGDVGRDVGLDDGLDGLRAVCWLGWTHGIRPVRAADEAAQVVLSGAGLPIVGGSPSVGGEAGRA